ncbi:hypothetical protein IRZ71_09095 [Flavobacterium sp. ANB]|uniref:hypothetical protein n=1 Tax=unclassified Flavobacterium TaxID=196869 RepID=UPI0012B8B72D|nr:MULTISPECIES: hypothetical protein [unclassified Flavobacterium]MBF4516499.1 hypothetical protein [Flavobacterium sp. ANB]MTD69604.1 hypothetical protein [Flavobacterium sp. LC2016-13]
MVNKFRNFAKNNSVRFSFLLVYAGFIYLKVANFENYNFYDGKIIGLHKIVTNNHLADGHGSVLIGREIPEIEYYVNGDTIRCDQGELRLVTNFELNEKITVLVDKEYDYKTKIYSLFYYWIDYNELIVFLLAFLFILGFIKNFF